MTTNRDFVVLARRMRVGRVIYLRCLEDRAVEAMKRAIEWLAENRLPDGRVLRVPIRGDITVLAPIEAAPPSPD